MDSKAIDEHQFVIPKRAVTQPNHMHLWEKSEAYCEYLGFIMALNESVKGKPLTVGCSCSDNITGILRLLDKLDQNINDTPPIDQPSRFGNQAFRTWFTNLKETALVLLQDALPEMYHRAVPEIMAYLIDGFGNATRIDYGTGHEMSFLMLLCCLFKIGALKKEDQIAVVTKVFNRYLILVRKLQLTYRMEPAGSHGVWSLDDYQFMPFIWGSSQLIAHPRIEPKSFLQANIVEGFAQEYMFLGSIAFINEVKTGMFAEHSNQLWNISAVPSWSKVNGGLIKMYKAEVLAKFPVIQHVLFGSLMSIQTAEPSVKKPSDRLLAMPPPAVARRKSEEFSN